MLKVIINEKKSFEFSYRKFQRACDKVKIVKEARYKMYYEKPTTRRRKQRISALRRNYVKYKLPNLKRQ